MNFSALLLALLLGGVSVPEKDKPKPTPPPPPKPAPQEGNGAKGVKALKRQGDKGVGHGNENQGKALDKIEKEGKGKKPGPPTKKT